MQSRCNGTCVAGGYEIGRSATASEILAGTWIKRRYSSFELVFVALCTPLAGKGVLRVSKQM